MSEPFTMPILGNKWPKPKESVTFVPTAEDRQWSERNHYQTLERIRERGGFGWCELAAVFERRKWRSMPEDEARAVCTARELSDAKPPSGASHA